MDCNETTREEDAREELPVSRRSVRSGRRAKRRKGSEQGLGGGGDAASEMLADNSSGRSRKFGIFTNNLF
jgi:hypothetical protein